MGLKPYISSFFILSIALLTGCTAPSVYLQKEADTYEYQRLELQGKPFTHISYLSIKDPTNPRLHVYIEGDGIPWVARYFIASDPTPRSSVVFDLMAMDPHRSLYLGRPCYLGQAQSPPCAPLFWTHKRHAPEVIESMRIALNRYLQLQPASELIFIGHSGGGAIAMLLAQRFAQTKAIVTLGGNLDIDAWTTHHGYTPLYGSLNPASLPAFHNGIRQIHIAAENDTVIPPHLIQNALKNQPLSEFILLKNATHTCCWQRIWPNTLEKLTGIR